MPLPGLVSPPGFFKAVETGPNPPVTANLKVHFEMDATIPPTATSWVDEVAGINLTVQPSMVAPSIIAGGTPTGQDYYEFTVNEGLGTILLAGEDIPADADSRSMYLVCRFESTQTPKFHGVVYGDPSGSDEGFGLILDPSFTTISVDFFFTLFNSSSLVKDSTFHVLLVSYDALDNILIERDNVSGLFVDVGIRELVLEKLYINELIDNTVGAEIDVAAILIYAGAHNAADRLATFNYLNDKYIGA